jgi:hypothetical protein
MKPVLQSFEIAAVILVGWGEVGLLLLIYE